MNPRLIVVVGPTAAGKSNLALTIAQAVGGEIVSADSQQIYRGMDIGTGKLSLQERQGVAHHLLDVIDPTDALTVKGFMLQADAVIAAVTARHKPVVVVGGTGLYVRVLLYGLFDGPGQDPVVRAALFAEAERAGTQAMWDRLASVDPPAAERIDWRDIRRIVRALEVFALTGVAMSEWQAKSSFAARVPRYSTLKIGLFPAREILYQRINRRVLGMVASGWLDEVAALRRAGVVAANKSQEAIGYRQLHGVLAGDCELESAIAVIQQETRNYARRQVSWYRPEPDILRVTDAEMVDFRAIERYLASPPAPDWAVRHE